MLSFERVKSVSFLFMATLISKKRPLRNLQYDGLGDLVKSFLIVVDQTTIIHSFEKLNLMDL